MIEAIISGALTILFGLFVLLFIIAPIWMAGEQDREEEERNNGNR